ncbi:hypothetical protein [Chitinophaga barathri]|nr:hypothetical protein [Chitinophaga barathri]
MKRIFLAVILVVCAQVASAQYYKTDTVRGFDPSRLMVGGSFGMGFGDYTLVNISPIIGYRFTPMFAGGLALNAQLSWEKLRDYDGEIFARNNYNMLGGGLWGRFYPIPQLFLQAQPEYNSITEKYRDYRNDPVVTVKSRYGAPSLLLGGGYAQPIGMGNSAFVIMILYDVLQDENSPYRNRPVISAGVNVGF